jgi:hypothetical protein
MGYRREALFRYFVITYLSVNRFFVIAPGQQCQLLFRMISSTDFLDVLDLLMDTEHSFFRNLRRVLVGKEAL